MWILKGDFKWGFCKGILNGDFYMGILKRDYKWIL